MLGDNPYQQYPLFIPTKGRWKTPYTATTLARMNMHFRAIVEEQEYDEYVNVFGKDRVVILDPEFQKKYETLDDLGDSKSKGPGPARNFAWELSKSEGYEWHWVMDDNIYDFWRFNQNKRLRIYSPRTFQIMEDFTLRYTNVAMAGPQYKGFIAEKHKYPPVVFNTRIYSCNFIRNDLPFRWRGRYNEDTDLSLQMLKAGWCTIEFNTILQGKLRTQTVAGGNTGEFYAKEGTFSKSAMLLDIHPDVTRLVMKYGRVHHQVDYTKFKRNKLIRRTDIEIPTGVDEYGLTLGKAPDRKASPFEAT